MCFTIGSFFCSLFGPRQKMNKKAKLTELDNKSKHPLLFSGRLPLAAKVTDAYHYEHIYYIEQV